MAITRLVPYAKNQIVSYTNNGFSTDSFGGIQFPLQKGVPFQNNYSFKIIPASTSNTCVTSSQAWVDANASYVLNASDSVNGTEIITQSIIYKGQRAILMDCERSLSVTLSGTTTTATNIIFSGYDYRGVAVSYLSTLASGASGTICLGLPISIVTRITSSANPGVNMSFGNAASLSDDTLFIGLPYFLPQKSYVNRCVWDNADVDVDNIYVGNHWRLNPIVNQFTAVFPSSSAIFENGLTRGGILVPSAPDGSKILYVNYFVYGSDGEMVSELQNGIQSTYNLVGIEQNNSGQYVWPFMTSYDLTGMAYPGDLVAAQAYNTLLNE